MIPSNNAEPLVPRGMNRVVVDRSALHPRHNKALNKLVRAVLPFAYGFYHIETDISLRIVFASLGHRKRGSFGYPAHNSHKAVEIRLSAKDRHQQDTVDTFFHEFTHFWQMLEGRNDPLNISYYQKGKFCPKTYRDDPLEIEARLMEKLMLDSYQRYRNNYRGAVPCSVSVNDYVYASR
jgi:hypothetical protein